MQWKWPLFVWSSVAQKGLDVSLFKRLSEAHPQAVVELTFQYRMNEDIMLLSNKVKTDYLLQVFTSALMIVRVVAAVYLRRKAPLRLTRRGVREAEHP